MQNDDFQQFLGGGYQQLLKELEIDVYDVLKEPAPRVNEHIQILKRYCQRFELF